MAVRGEWRKIISLTESSGAVRSALRETTVEPAGDGVLCVVCLDPGIFSIINREPVLEDLRAAVSRHCSKSIEFKARLESSGEAVSASYVSEEEMQRVIHDDIVVEE